MRLALPGLALLLFVPLGLRAQSGVAPAAPLPLVRGVVRAQGTGQPLANALVSITDVAETRTDSSGEFQLAAVPVGLHRLGITLIGYAPLVRVISLGGTDSLRIDVVLAPTTTRLAEVNVRAEAVRPMLAEFEERRKSGFGHFLTVEEFDRWQGSKLGDIVLRRIPGVRVERGELISSRGSVSFGSSRCAPAVWIDGMLQTAVTPFRIDSVDPSQIMAAEFHSIATLPLRYNQTGNSPCGALLLWLRH